MAKNHVAVAMVAIFWIPGRGEFLTSLKLSLTIKPRYENVKRWVLMASDETQRLQRVWNLLLILQWFSEILIIDFSRPSLQSTSHSVRSLKCVENCQNQHWSWFRLCSTYAVYRILHALVVKNYMHNSLRSDRFTTNIKLTAQDHVNWAFQYQHAAKLPLPNLLYNVLFHSNSFEYLI